MKEFKSSASRLARLFKKSRDDWKAKAAEKQKKIRALEIKVRDLSESRDRWKQQAKSAQQSVAKTDMKTVTLQETEEEETFDNVLEGEWLPQNSLLAPKGHVYPVFVIQLAVQQMIQGFVSLRGCQLTFELFSQFFEVATPSFSSIRNWLYRIGLYALSQPNVYREDWILIPDFTSEFGTKRCLVILGIFKERFCDEKRLFRDNRDKPSFALRHLDVELLAIEVLESSTGQIIEGILTQLTDKIGTPLQIVADHGNDLKNGIERYQHKNSNVIYTHDITHHLGILFKQALGNDPKYQSFCQKCSLTRSQIQQTHLHFLIPPKQNYKSRYLNVDDYVKWANHVLAYQAKNDYSLISQVYSLDEETYATLTRTVDKKTLLKLKRLGNETYVDKESFIESITVVIGHRAFQKMGSTICQAASLGQRKFRKHFGWLEEYQPELITYTQMVDLALHVEAQVKNVGLNKKSKELFEEEHFLMELTSRSQQFKQQVINYLSQESAKVPEEQTLLAASDVIESLFGKYKQFTSTNCLKELGKRILTIPLCTLSITGELVQNAIENVREIDVENWANSIFGQSVLSKRREAFPSVNKTQK